MATRSLIGKRFVDDKVLYIYCHSDGYPAGVGAYLNKWYSTEDEVDALLACGDISFIGSRVPSEDLKDFIADLREIGKADNNFIRSSFLRRDITLSYNMWRLENDCEVKVATLDEFKNIENGWYGSEYRYLFEEGEWKVITY